MEQMCGRGRRFQVVIARAVLVDKLCSGCAVAVRRAAATC